MTYLQQRDRAEVGLNAPVGQSPYLAHARDYQDLSALAYLRARRFRDRDCEPWLCASAQDDAASVAWQARVYLFTLLGQREA